MARKLTKEAALAELNELIEATRTLAGKRLWGEEHTAWVMRTVVLLEEAFGRASLYYLNFQAISWRYKGTLFARSPGGIDRVREEADHKVYLAGLETARGLLQAAISHLERSDLDSVYSGKDTASESSMILRVVNLAEVKLRKAIRAKPELEKTVQDAFESLLIGADVAYSREAERIEYSSKTYVPDFTVAKLELAIEIKLCSREGREKEIIAEINDDIAAYKTEYSNLIFVVYDLGFIRDADKFIGSFEEHTGVVVRIVKH